MSSRNDSGAMMGVAFVMAGLIIAAMFVFAVLVFLALGLTLLCAFAWHSPVRLGSLTITPEEARQFVRRGVIGAGVLPAFALFCEVLFAIRLTPEVWPYLFIGGYTAGSLGLAILEAQAEEDATTAATIDLPAVRQIAPPAQAALPPPAAPHPSQEPQPFRFASWDDEMDGTGAQGNADSDREEDGR